MPAAHEGLRERRRHREGRRRSRGRSSGRGGSCSSSEQIGPRARRPRRSFPVVEVEKRRTGRASGLSRRPRRRREGRFRSVEVERRRAAGRASGLSRRPRRGSSAGEDRRAVGLELEQRQRRAAGPVSDTDRSGDGQLGVADRRIRSRREEAQRTPALDGRGLPGLLDDGRYGRREVLRRSRPVPFFAEDEPVRQRQRRRRRRERPHDGDRLGGEGGSLL
mmetsp:Transcript_2025/g.5349  ORF Transcript_2025/g.5349 Transcript_2025/m.5349 type:complete len:220 (+) Transcript_2025:208-867(+)